MGITKNISNEESCNKVKLWAGHKIPHFCITIQKYDFFVIINLYLFELRNFFYLGPIELYYHSLSF